MLEIINNFKTIKAAAAEDIRTSSYPQRIGFIATAATLTGHELAMIEALYAVGTQTLNYTHNPLMVSGAMGGFSLAVETGLSLGIASSIRTFPKAIDKIKDAFFKNDVKEVSTKSDKALKAFDTSVLALTLGSPGVVLGDYARNPNKTYQENRRTGLRAARALGGFNAFLGLIIAGGALAAEELGTNVVTDVLTETGQSPYFYASTFGLLGLRAAYGGMKKRKAQKKLQ